MILILTNLKSDFNARICLALRHSGLMFIAEVCLAVEAKIFTTAHGRINVHSNRLSILSLTQSMRFISADHSRTLSIDDPLSMYCPPFTRTCTNFSVIFTAESRDH
jgi:hypothetical protein